MNEMRTQILIGLLILIGSLLGIRHDLWILRESRYGRVCVWMFGSESGGLKGLRVALGLLALFGLLLALNVVRPIHW